MTDLHPATAPKVPQRSRGMNGNTYDKILANLAQPGFRSTVPGRMMWMTLRYGIPIKEVARFVGVDERSAHRWVNAPNSIKKEYAESDAVAARLTILERSAPFLDEHYFRPRTWREALSLCEAQLTRQE